MSSTGKLTGAYWVRATRAALSEGHKWFPRVRDRMIVRRHALKLRWFPRGSDGEHVQDLDWEYIKSLPGEQIGELRIHDSIGGHDNIRVIFWVAPQKSTDPMQTIWILSVFQKKRDDFTAAQLATFRARKKILESRL